MSVWKKLSRVGKKAAKFQFTASFQEVELECTKNYVPGNIVIIWTRRSRRYSSKPIICKPKSAFLLPVIPSGKSSASETSPPRKSSQPPVPPQDQQGSGKSGSIVYQHVWSMPENLEISTTLYRSEKDIRFEEKEWAFQLEDTDFHMAGIWDQAK
ncbi:unnamed protein product [Protopolystoma xenopodis]|uniref:C2 NT-type domain-containing protein n=1 Tax=Protopolystoma xenopodis TaxID=117903 RepID=A0A448XPY3_9PLAT|nr:unnamed protein product [Protopolystoma xenopodis]